MSMTSGRSRICMRGHFDAERSACKPSRLMVTQRKCNHSAFNGYHETRSDYSTVTCCECGNHWRSKADYVDRLPDAPEAWWNLGPQQLVTWFDQQKQRSSSHG